MTASHCGTSARRSRCESKTKFAIMFDERFACSGRMLATLRHVLPQSVRVAVRSWAISLQDNVIFLPNFYMGVSICRKGY
jgi:hypothetical protein